MRYEFGGLVHGGAYFRNFTVFTPKECKCKEFCLQTRLGGEICSSDVIMHKGQVVQSFSFKARLSAKPLICIVVQIKLIFTRKVLH